MPTTPAYAALSPSSPLTPFSVERRNPGPEDVVIDIRYCGICHSDLHQARDEWGGALFPMVPGHEIVGEVARVGERVTRFAVGDLVGVGCMVDSCRRCDACRLDHEQFCEQGWPGLQRHRDGPRDPHLRRLLEEHRGPRAVRPQAPEGPRPRRRRAALVRRDHDLLAAAPVELQAGPPRGGGRPGGLGHMAVKLAASMGAEVTLLSTSRAKQADAARLGAHAFELSTEEATFKRLAGRFDLIVDTVSAPHDYNAFLRLLKPLATMVLVGAPPEPQPLSAFSLIPGNKGLAGSLIGGITETQEMLDYCGEHGIVSDVEVIPIQTVNQAWERMLRSDVRYRFVIDIASLE